VPAIVRVQRFEQLGSPRSSIMAKLILRHINKTMFFVFFEPFRLRLPSKIAKSVNMIKKIVKKKCKMDIKNAEFDDDFESVEKRKLIL
jgi:hypothetical protein